MTNVRYHLRRVNGVRAERAHKSEAPDPRRAGGRGTFDRRRGTDSDGRGGSRDGVHLSDDRVPVLPEPTRAAGGRTPRDRGRIAAARGSARRCRCEARHRRCCIHADDPRQRVSAANDASTLTRSQSRGAIAVAAPARPRDQVARRSPRTTAATAATLGGASTRHRHPQRDRNRSTVMADRCRWPLPRGRHRSHALVSSRHARRHDCGPIRNQEEGAGWSTRRCAISVSRDIVASSPSRPTRRFAQRSGSPSVSQNAQRLEGDEPSQNAGWWSWCFAALPLMKEDSDGAASRRPCDHASGSRCSAR